MFLKTFWFYSGLDITKLNDTYSSVVYMLLSMYLDMKIINHVQVLVN